MTFADRKIRQLVRKRFVCAWMDTTGDPVAGESFEHGPKEPPCSCMRGNGEHNVQIVALTPGGRMLSVVAGYIGPRDLEKELRLVLKLFDQGPRLDKQRVAAAHRGVLEKLAQQQFEGPLAGWSKRRAIEDHRFMVDHPLMEVTEFKPEMLVGNAKTFFGSRNGRARATAGLAPEDFGKQKEG